MKERKIRESEIKSGTEKIDKYGRWKEWEREDKKKKKKKNEVM